MLMGRIVGAALAICAASSCTQAPPRASSSTTQLSESEVSNTVAGDELALRRLSGTEVLGLSGERLGRIQQVLLDIRPRGQHYVVVELEEGKGFPYPVNALDMGGADATLPVARHDLRELPGYRNGEWPALAAPGRFIQRRALIGRDVVDPLGNRIARVREVVVDPDTARTRYYRIEFDGGEVLPIPAREMRLSQEGPAVLHARRHRRG